MIPPGEPLDRVAAGSESPTFISSTSIGLFVLASGVAWGIIANANPYSGANVAMAAMVSGPVYLLGVLASIRCLRITAFRSVLGWAALTLNTVPFGFAVFLVGALVSGVW